MSTVVFFHAHPDDEAIATGGTMARLVDEGHRVVLVTATRGELGEIPEGLLRPGESLVERRMAELTEACRLLGCSRQVFLDYLDSGMAGEPTNHRPGSFAGADVEEAGSALAALLREESAEVLVTYDEHGGYGHPDHIQVHRVGMAAAEMASTPVVYLSTMNRDFLIGLSAESGGASWQPDAGATERMATMGEPESRITTTVDVSPWIEVKRRSMQAHASQISESSFFLSMPEDVFRKVWGQEWFIRARPAPPVPDQGTDETSLLVEAVASRAGVVPPGAQGR